MKVQLVNPWNNANPPDMNMTWLDIVQWAENNVHDASSTRKRCDGTRGAP